MARFWQRAIEVGNEEVVVMKLMRTWGLVISGTLFCSILSSAAAPEGDVFAVAGSGALAPDAAWPMFRHDEHHTGKFGSW